MEFALEISPDSLLFEDYNFAEMLEFEGADITINSAVYENGKLVIKTDYSSDLVHSELSLNVKESHYFDPTLPQESYDTLFNTSKATFKLGKPKDPAIVKNADEGKFKVKTSNNLEPYYYTE